MCGKLAAPELIQRSSSRFTHPYSSTRHSHFSALAVMLRARLSRGNKGLMSPHDPAKLGMLTLLLLLLSYGVCNASCSTIPDNSTDMLSLLDFKRAITNNPGGALRSWNSSIPHCQWEGVACSLKHPGRATVLSLGSLRLAGPISPSIGNLTFLETLNLSTNSFAGELPPLNRFHRMQTLVLAHNSLHGIIPDTNCTGNSLSDYGQSVHASTPGDVYSFGIVLLEMLIGKRPTDFMFSALLTLWRGTFQIRS
nr:LRR receptor-like serine/threonine-protein kinase EFR isoform X2 [Setaria viridis]